MFVARKAITQDAVVYLYSYLHHRVLLVEDDAQKFYWRKEWEHDYSKSEDSEYIAHVLNGLSTDYILNSEFVSFWKKHLVLTSFMATGTGAEHYIEQIPELREKVLHPVTGGMWTLRLTIIDLNDAHGWTREQIADWLETLDVNPILN